MNREVIKIDAQNKEEAITGLELLLDVIKNSEHDGRVVERVLVTNEGNVIHSK